MANFPNWSPASAAATTVASTFSRDLQSNLVLIQSALKGAMGAARSLEEYTRITLADDGGIGSGALVHGYVTGVTASQHHSKLHGSAHIDGTDNIPVATTATKGLMTSTQYQKLSNVISNATYNPAVASTYTGTTAGSLVVTVGYQLNWITIWQVGSGGVSWETIRGHSFVLRHVITSVVPHRFDSIATRISILTTGFKAKGSLNVTNVQYRYMAVK